MKNNNNRVNLVDNNMPFKKKLFHNYSSQETQKNQKHANLQKSYSAIKKYSYILSNSNTMLYNSFGITDKGLVRENNEDSIYLDSENGILIVADGIGGHKGGEVASKMAVNTVTKYILEQINSTEKSHLDNSSPKDQIRNNNNKNEEKVIKQVLNTALLKANSVVKKRSLSNDELEGMGTTIAIAIIRKNNNDVYIANVGDSRIYRINRTSITALTYDHTMANELVKAGHMSEAEAKHSPFKHRLTRHIGGFSPKSLTKDCILCTNWDDGDYLLLCSDGLTDMLDNKEIQEIVMNIDNKSKEGISIDSNPLSEICRSLVAKANERGGRDNITIIIAKNTEKSKRVDQTYSKRSRIRQDNTKLKNNDHSGRTLKRENNSRNDPSKKELNKEEKTDK